MDKTSNDVTNENNVSQIERLLKDLHAEHERKLKSIVDHAVREAFADFAPAMLPMTDDLPMTDNQESNSCVAPEPRGDDKTVSTKLTNDKLPTADTNAHLDNDKANNKRLSTASSNANLQIQHGAFERSVKDVTKGISRVVKLAMGDDGDQQSIGRWRSKLEEIVSDPKFDYFVATFILANAIVIAIQTEAAASDPTGETPPVFKGIDLFFTIFFTIELTIRMVLEGKRFILGRNQGWNVFDTFVVVSAILEQFLAASTNTTAIRVLRIMRLVRVIRVIRTLRIFNDLRAMVKGIVSSILALVWALVLLFIICFVIGIFITQVVTGFRQDNQDSDYNEVLMDKLEDNFGSLGDTMYSLYKAISGGDDWSIFADPLFEVYPPLGIFFCWYIAFAVLAVLNVVTGVFVDNAIKANQQDADVIIMEQTEARKKHIETVKSVFKKADSDDSGVLDVEEFKEHIGNPYVQAFFRQLDLDIEASGAQSLFNLLDFDGNGSIDVDEFIFGCGHLKGHARSLDLARVASEQKRTGRKLLALVCEQNERLDAMLQNFSRVRTQLGGLEQRYKMLGEKFSQSLINEASDAKASAPSRVAAIDRRLNPALSVPESFDPKPKSRNLNCPAPQKTFTDNPSHPVQYNPNYPAAGEAGSSGSPVVPTEVSSI